MEISTALIYTVKLTEREFTLVSKRLALVAGVAGPTATPDDRELAGQLNTRLLDQQAADLREKLAAAEHKRKQ